jgi:hypothetical protein
VIPIKKANHIIDLARERVSRQPGLIQDLTLIIQDLTLID